MNKPKIYKRMGWVSIIVGTVSSFFLCGLLLLAFPKSNLAFYIQAISALFSIGWGVFLLAKGRALGIKEVKTKEDNKEKLLNSFAAKQGGILKAASVATLLGISKSEAESYVVDLIKQSRPINFEIDNDGEFVFYFDVPKVRVASPVLDEEFFEEEDDVETQLRQRR